MEKKTKGGRVDRVKNPLCMPCMKFILSSRGSSEEERATLPIEKSPQPIEWADGQADTGNPPSTATATATATHRPTQQTEWLADAATLFLLFYNQLCHAHSAKIFHCAHTQQLHTHTQSFTHTQRHTHRQAHTILNCNGRRRRWAWIGICYLPHTAHIFTYPHTHTHTQKDRQTRSRLYIDLAISHTYVYESSWIYFRGNTKFDWQCGTSNRSVKY